MKPLHDQLFNRACNSESIRTHHLLGHAFRQGAGLDDHSGEPFQNQGRNMASNGKDVPLFAFRLRGEDRLLLTDMSPHFILLGPRCSRLLISSSQFS